MEITEETQIHKVHRVFLYGWMKVYLRWDIREKKIVEERLVTYGIRAMKY